MGIRAKLVLCLLAVLLPLVAVSLFSINLLGKQLVERTESSLSNTQRLEAARINEVLASYAQDARNLASGTQVRQFVAACNAYRQAVLNNADLAARDLRTPSRCRPRSDGRSSCRGRSS